MTGSKRVKDPNIKDSILVFTSTNTFSYFNIMRINYSGGRARDVTRVTLYMALTANFITELTGTNIKGNPDSHKRAQSH